MNIKVFIDNFIDHIIYVEDSHREIIHYETKKIYSSHLEKILIAATFLPKEIFINRY